MARTSKAAQAKRAAQQAETATLEPEATAVLESEHATATEAVSETREDAPAEGTAPEQVAGTDAGADAKESEQAKPPAPPKKTGQAKPATSAGMVEATLTARWASGGRAHKAGDKVRMTRGTYERLKKYGRVK